MARRTTTRRAKPPVKAAPPVLPDTEDGLMSAIVKLCDEFDAAMARPRGMVHLDYPAQVPPNVWAAMRERMRLLMTALEKLKFPGSLEDELDQYLKKAIGVPAGAVPPWSRPGEFLMWIGFVPVRCRWDGYPMPDATMLAADPRQPFSNTDGMENVPLGIEPDMKTVEDVFRKALLHLAAATTWDRNNKRVPAFKLVPLDASTRDEVAEYLAANSWLQEALRRGPVRPLQLPPHLHAVQLAL